MHDEARERPVTASAVVGRLLAGVFAAVSLLRPARPIHPRGVALRGSLERSGTAVPSGVDWIDVPGRDGVEARVSRSIGLPLALPDIIGLALRMDGGARGDLFLASTGLGVPSRYVLHLLGRADRARFSTVIPYRGRRGPVLIGARTLTAPPLPARPRALASALAGGEWALELYHARPLGRWHRFGTLTLAFDEEAGAIDTDRRLDPILHVLPGSEQYAWAARIREPAYRVARGGRDA